MKLLILYSIPKNHFKYEKWTDGFTQTINILKTSYDIDLVNSKDNLTIDFNTYDIVFFKESFEGKIYKKYQQQLVLKNKIGLIISASNIIPTDSQLKIYDLLFYETYWYCTYAKLNRHKNAYHAFGVDTNIMKKINTNKEFDVIFVGAICEYKRPLHILNIPGTKVCIGTKSDKSIELNLRKNDVHIKDFVSHEELAILYNKSNLCYIPCKTHGGGERAVLEARACGIPVKIEDDNFKLKELCECNIYTVEYYASQLKLGIDRLIYQDCNFNKRIKFWKKNPLIGEIDIHIDDYNFKMQCDNDDTVVKELYWTNFNGWERNEINMVLQLCKINSYDYFFDIGSYSGFYSMLLSSIFPGIPVYSFEIIDKIFERLNCNANLNKFSNIITTNKGVSNKDGVEYISKGSTEHGLSSVSCLVNNQSCTSTIDVVSIDNFFNKTLKDKKILIKIDTEGTEEKVISGMKQLLDDNKVDIFIEVNDGMLKKFNKVFEKYTKINFGRNYFFINTP